MAQVSTYALTAALSGLATRQQIGNILNAIQSSNSGTTAPTNPVAGMFWLDTSTPPAILRIRNDANTAWVVFAPADGAITNAKLATVPTATLKGRVSAGTGVVEDLTPAQARTAMGVDPAGQVSMFAMNTAPSGWLKANGALVSRGTYAALFAAIGTTFGAGDGTTTFALPDLRGEFQRGWDDGRGVDSGRAFGSMQASQNLSHSHSGATSGVGDHSHPTGIGGAFIVGQLGSGVSGFGGGGSFSFTNSTAATGSGGAHNHTFTTNSDGGTEARPRNVALLACIKF